ncbi:bifunctional 3'-5' exonuclease/DNA polymerase [Crossiella sp. SN42]|uniref:bifunctional 3'-5' exonuclease/DNA polymerase n=1 Tax=Crossiella sp. SN42 TaxID=2944808 RepID=UPI00207D59AD|nr:bifunctional 3'-5' exonuclease/DNA polymerase [Crossiella sp. SN42]MCO1582533.1 bifunctional 3'-5' exonuclease/DNA polymerase [Crossiella sp. SN42]
MRIAVVTSPNGEARLCELSEDGRPVSEVTSTTALAGTVAELERAHQPRWVLANSAELYPRLLRAGVRLTRCHDLELTESLLSGHAGRWGEPRGLAAAYARQAGLPVPPDPPVRPRDEHPTLFETARTDLPEVDPLDAVIAVHRDQQARISALAQPGRFRLLVAAESAGGLAAAELGHVGVPWRADIHDALLTELLGPRTPAGVPPPKLAELTERIIEAFGGRRFHPDSPAEVLKAFAKAGHSLPSTRSWVIKGVDHPAVPLLLEYKELYRIYTAHGWSWLSAWVRDGRFRPEWVAGGVVSGRWATRGGGALQIPKTVRRAVVADPGWSLVVADASQLEPRVLAALAGDQRLAAAGASGDLYTALAEEAFGGDRDRAKIGMLGVMYGQTSGGAGELLAALRKRYPAAIEYVERAARTGELGGLVRSHLGRTCPPPGSDWQGIVEDAETETGQARQARARGRFTRNFVVQATASEWALALLACLRTSLREPAELVFFQHDEVIVHCPSELAEEVVAAVQDCAERATRLLFGDTPVRFPLNAVVADCYADAK